MTNHERKSVEDKLMINISTCVEKVDLSALY